MTDMTAPPNKHLVGRIGERIVMQMPPLLPMTDDEALALAAWLVACAYKPSQPFEAVLAAVENT